MSNLRILGCEIDKEDFHIEEFARTYSALFCFGMDIFDSEGEYPDLREFCIDRIETHDCAESELYGYYVEKKLSLVSVLNDLKEEVGITPRKLRWIQSPDFRLIQIEFDSNEETVSKISLSEYVNKAQQSYIEDRDLSWQQAWAIDDNPAKIFPINNSQLLIGMDI